MLPLVLAILLLLSYALGRRQAYALTAHPSAGNLHSLPSYHGCYVALWCGIPALLVMLAWTACQQSVIRPMVLSEISSEYLEQRPPAVVFAEIKSAASRADREAPRPEVAAGVSRYLSLQRVSQGAMTTLVLLLAVSGALFGRTKVSARFPARIYVEQAFTAFLFLSSLIAILTTVGIVCSLIFESIQFFRIVPLSEFLFGLRWSPQIAIRPDQVGSSGAFGAVPLFAGTLMISGIAMAVATPIGLMSAIYLSEYANKRLRGVIKPVLEILAGVPTVVYGFFAALTVAPVVRMLGESLGLSVSSESAMAAGLVMGMMIIPFVSSLSDDVINAVPQSLRDASYAIGATKAETIKKVIVPAALPGIVGALLLAVSRAIGETMIVVMAAGLSAKLTLNPFENVTTVTVQIVTMLVGDQEFDSPKTLGAFALGLALFCITLVLNVIALQVVKRYRETYE